MLARVLLIAVGGGLGSICRYQLGKTWPDHAHTLPLTTLGINLLGSLLLGLLIIAVTETWSAPEFLRPFLGTGVLGGFTTFSTFALQTQSLPAAEAAFYLGVSVIGGPALALVGMSLTRKVKPNRVHVLELDPDLP